MREDVEQIPVMPMCMESAYEWGLRHCSCREALEAREALGPNKTQADWWRECPRGDWLLWQLDRLSPETQAKIKPRLTRAIEVIVTSAIVEHALDCGVPAVEDWAAKWLSGEDRSIDAAREAAWEAAREAAAWAAVRAAEAAAAARAPVWVATAELRMQADDIRAEIPEWPGEEHSPKEVSEP